MLRTIRPTAIVSVCFYTCNRSFYPPTSSTTTLPACRVHAIHMLLLYVLIPHRARPRVTCHQSSLPCRVGLTYLCPRVVGYDRQYYMQYERNKHVRRHVSSKAKLKRALTRVYVEPSIADYKTYQVLCSALVSVGQGVSRGKGQRCSRVKGRKKKRALSTDIFDQNGDGKKGPTYTITYGGPIVNRTKYCYLRGGIVNRTKYC